MLYTNELKSDSCGYLIIYLKTLWKIWLKKSQDLYIKTDAVYKHGGARWTPSDTEDSSNEEPKL
jgi:hypothetical protein